MVHLGWRKPSRADRNVGAWGAWNAVSAVSAMVTAGPGPGLRAPKR